MFFNSIFKNLEIQSSHNNLYCMHFVIYLQFVETQKLKVNISKNCQVLSLYEQYK